MKLFGMVSDQGTCASETVLCEEHATEEERRGLEDTAAPDIVKGSWTDVSGNDAAVCCICDAKNWN